MACSKMFPCSTLHPVAEDQIIRRIGDKAASPFQDVPSSKACSEIGYSKEESWTHRNNLLMNLMRLRR